ncbi:MAG: nitrophenyl compound nitroreductase subunit ArsF family protein [Planctomycetota bacterium]|jgi:hypothetical protein
MNWRRTTAGLLGLFVCVSLVYLVIDEATRAAPGAGEAATPADTGTARRQVMVYYFHGDRRCQTCNRIEAYAEEALRSAFPDAWASGALAWRTVNIDDAANEHFRERYGLFTSTLVLSRVVGGEERDWRDLDEVWHLVGDKTAFCAYVRRETRSMLEETP